MTGMAPHICFCTLKGSAAFISNKLVNVFSLPAWEEPVSSEKKSEPVALSGQVLPGWHGAGAGNQGFTVASIQFLQPREKRSWPKRDLPRTMCLNSY